MTFIHAKENFVSAAFKPSKAVHCLESSAKKNLALKLKPQEFSHLIKPMTNSLFFKLWVKMKRLVSVTQPFGVRLKRHAPIHEHIARVLNHGPRVQVDELFF